MSASTRTADQPLWRPGPERVAKSNVTAFIAAANKRHGLKLKDYREPIRASLAAALGLARDKVEVICPDVVGGFGTRTNLAAEQPVLAVAARQIDAFVQDEHVLRFLAKQDFAGRVQVLPGTYDEYFVSIALQQNSPLRKPINKALLSLMKTQQWTELGNRYIH